MIDKSNCLTVYIWTPTWEASAGSPGHVALKVSVSGKQVYLSAYLPNDVRRSYQIGEAYGVNFYEGYGKKHVTKVESPGLGSDKRRRGRQADSKYRFSSTVFDLGRALFAGNALKAGQPVFIVPDYNCAVYVTYVLRYAQAATRWWSEACGANGKSEILKNPSEIEVVCDWLYNRFGDIDVVERTTGVFTLGGEVAMPNVANILNPPFYQ